MGHSHIIAIDQDGLNKLPEDRHNAASELGDKILRLCEKFGNPLNRFAEQPSDKPQKQVAEFTVESIGNNVGAIHWVGFPGSDKDEMFYWGAAMKPIQQVDSRTLEWIKRRIEKEIEARQQYDTAHGSKS